MSRDFARGGSGFAVARRSQSGIVLALVLVLALLLSASIVTFARRAVIVSFADAETWKGRWTASRRRAIPVRQLRLDSLAANLTLESPVLRVGSLFSRFSVALLRVPQD